MKLTDITEGTISPQEVFKSKIDGAGNLNLYGRNLVTLRGCPEEIKGSLNIYNNALKSFNHAPKIIGRSVIAHNNLITTLKNIHHDIHHMGGGLVIDGKLIKSHVLGVFMVKGLSVVLQSPQMGDWANKDENMPKWMVCVNDCLRNEANKLGRKEAMYACQEKLIAMDLEPYAHP